MCRAPLYEDEADTYDADAAAQAAQAAQAVAAEAEQEQEEVEAFELSYQVEQAQGAWMTLQEMDLTNEEQSRHDDMMHVVNAHAERYCRNNPTCTYLGTNNLRTIRDRESDYSRIEVGAQNLNCHYVIELRDSSRAFRYKFGRIEDIRMMHLMFQGFSFFVFRELVDIFYEDTGYTHTVWSNETQLIAMQGGDVKSLRQYVPRLRMNA
jgi:hypothetical protein